MAVADSVCLLQFTLIDPTLFLQYLSSDDCLRFSVTCQKSLLQARMFVNVKYARLEARNIDENSWRTGLSTRGNGYLWKRLKRRLEVAPSYTADRVHHSILSTEEFATKYEIRSFPVIIEGLADSWPAKQKWKFQKLVDRFGDKVEFRFDDHYGELITLRQYSEYIKTTTDDCPLGLYDSQFGEDCDSMAFELAEEYSTPQYFSDDIFRYAESSDNEQTRPPWRWLLIGTERSGTELHIDPLYTSAWVTLLEGRKRWCMWPLGTDTKLLGGIAESDDTPMNALEWFLKYHENYPDGLPQPIEILQNPGETVFVPAGWPHIVINLETTVSATQNYASKWNLMNVWQYCKEKEPEFADYFKSCLKQRRGDLASQLE